MKDRKLKVRQVVNAFKTLLAIQPSVEPLVNSKQPERWTRFRCKAIELTIKCKRCLQTNLSVPFSGWSRALGIAGIPVNPALELVRDDTSTVDPSLTGDRDLNWDRIIVMQIVRVLSNISAIWFDFALITSQLF